MHFAEWETDVKKTDKAADERTPPLGELEVEVLELLWTADSLSAKQAHAHFREARGIALHTVQSTLERLFRKGLLEREKVSHAYRYRPCVAREQLLGSLIHDVFGRFHSDAASSAAAMVNAAESLDPDTLAWLEDQIRQRRESGDS